MNKDVKSQWVSALRSGEYEQGRGRLERDGKFCCLGVLCDLAVKAGVAKRVDDVHLLDGGVGFASLGNPMDSSAATPPWAVMRWARIGSDPLPALTIRELVNMNDIQELSFEQIADIIERGDL